MVFCDIWWIYSVLHSGCFDDRYWMSSMIDRAYFNISSPPVAMCPSITQRSSPEGAEGRRFESLQVPNTVWETACLLLPAEEALRTLEHTHMVSLELSEALGQWAGV